MTPRRILMTADTIGGVWTYATELAENFADFGIEVVLATMGRAVSADQRKQLGRLGNVELCESEFRLEWMENPWRDVEAAGKWLLGIEENFKPDLVHLNSFGQGALAWQVPHIVVGHSCVSSWWQAVKGEAIPRSWDRYVATVRDSLRSAAFVVAPTRGMLNELNFFYGPFSKYGVVHNFRNPTGFRADAKEEFLITAGRLWDEAKNLSLLLEIANQLPWSIYLAGEEQSAGASIRRSVYPLGKLDPEPLAEWLGRAAIYVAPALYEPFGLSILEAALSGCALVLADIPTLRELWNGAAIFIAPDDPQAWQAELGNLIWDKHRIKELAALARCRALKFNSAEGTRAYLDLYEVVLTASNSTAKAQRRFCENRDVLPHAVV